MQPLTLCAPLRPAVLGGRISTATLGYLSCPKPSFEKQPTRLASTSLNRMRETKTPFSAPVVLQMCSRPRASPAVAPSVPRITLRGNSTSSSSSSSSADAGAGDGRLNWDSFFKLRATRRRYSVASSAVTSAVTTVLGVQYLSTQDIESLGAQVMGLDPFVVLGMATMACGAAGWLLGPFVGNGVWSLVNRNYTTAFARKEKEFFDRIRRFRVDPSANSIANPVPDYYGEKIGSVQGYRQWLKDQRAYNRKKRSFIL